MNLQKATCISSRAFFPNMPKVGKTYFIDADTICSVEGQNFVDVYIQTNDKIEVYDYVGFFVLEHFAIKEDLI